MNTSDFSTAQGHWILAKMGKRVLRPGGKELTMKMMDALQIRSEDNIVEFAPGLGFTAGLALSNHPKTYVGIDEDKDVIHLLNRKLKTNGTTIDFIQSNAEKTTLPDESKDKIYGEAMLTMHADTAKRRIIKEAHRVLKKGGLYGIHEMGLTPDALPSEEKAIIQRELAKVIRVNARPLTVIEWKDLLESEGFKIKSIATNPMLLLETKRMIDDEGFWRTLKITYNIYTHPAAKKRIYAMKDVFNHYKDQLNSVMMVAEKL